MKKQYLLFLSFGVVLFGIQSVIFSATKRKSVTFMAPTMVPTPAGASFGDEEQDLSGIGRSMGEISRKDVSSSSTPGKEVSKRTAFGLDQYTLDSLFQRACFSAQLSKNSAVVTFLLDAGANVNVMDSSGETQLFSACRSNDVQFAKLLIKNGANVNIVSNAGLTPLLQVCQGRETVVDYGEDESIASNKTEIVRLLVNNGAFVDMQDSKDKTALDYVRAYGKNSELVQLISKGRTSQSK